MEEVISGQIRPSNDGYRLGLVPHFWSVDLGGWDRLTFVILNVQISIKVVDIGQKKRPPSKCSSYIVAIPFFQKSGQCSQRNWNSRKTNLCESKRKESNVGKRRVVFGHFLKMIIRACCLWPVIRSKTISHPTKRERNKTFLSIGWPMSSCWFASFH